MREIFTSESFLRLALPAADDEDEGDAAEDGEEDDVGGADAGAEEEAGADGSDDDDDEDAEPDEAVRRKQRKAAGRGGGSRGRDSGGSASRDGKGANSFVASSATAAAWAVAPLSSKHVARLTFRAHTAGLYAGYLHVKLPNDSMVIPVHFDVVRGGVYPSPSALVFDHISSG